jgi:two-component system chemotaxis sensor kinase CheA
VSEILDDFIFDSREQLENAGAQLMALERDPRSLSNINALMGILHTIKGNSGFVNLRHLYELLHSAESLLQTVREAPGHFLPPRVIESLFQVLDTVEAIMARLEGGEDDEVDWMGSLVETLGQVSKALDSGELSEEGAGPPEAQEAQAGLAGPPEAPEAQAGPARAPDPLAGLAEDPEAPAPQAGALKPPPAKTIQAHPLRPPAPGEPKAQALRRGRKPKARPESPVAGEAPAAGPPGGAARAGAGPFAVGAGGIPRLALSDGQLEAEGEGLLSQAGALRSAGAPGLILDLSGLGSLTSAGLGTLRGLHAAWGRRLALVLSQDGQPDLFRVLEVTGLLKTCRIFPGEGTAEAALRQGA